MLLSTIIFEMEKDPWYIVGEYNQKIKSEADFKIREVELKAETLKEIAVEMKKNGIYLNLISNVTKLPVEEIMVL